MIKKELRDYQQKAVSDYIEAVETDHTKNYIIVIPGGGGKSLIQSAIVDWILQFEHTRVLCITNDARIIKQNYDEFIEYTGFLDAGIYSAGLKSRDQYNRVIFAGIQSIYKKALQIGAFDLIIADECHAINHKAVGQYRTFLNECKNINKSVLIAGMSATPYRMTDGALTEGEDKLFDEICHETPITLLQAQGYLVNFVTPKKALESSADLTGVKKTAGDYNKKELEKRYDIVDKVQKAVSEIISYTKYRNKILIFCAGIEHAEHVCTEFKKQSNRTIDVVHSKKKESKEIIEKFSTDELQILCNKDMLTTGYNNPAIDCIVLLMSTMSAGKYVQMVVRGSRIFDKEKIIKKDCLVLDFGSNLLNHGCIDKIECVKNSKTGDYEINKSPQKECPVCNCLIDLQSRECIDCGYVFEREINHDEKPDLYSNVISEYKKPELIDISSIRLLRHPGRNGKPDTLKISYYSGISRIVDEYICIEHEGYAQKMAYKTLTEYNMHHLKSIEEAIEQEEFFTRPDKIMVDFNGKFPKVLKREFKQIDYDDIPF